MPMERAREGRTGRRAVGAAASLLCAALVPVDGAAQQAAMDGDAFAAFAGATVGVVALHRVDVIAARGGPIAVPVASLGSGAVVSSDGVVATARDVVHGAAFVALRIPGSTDLVPAVRVNPAEDNLALLVAVTTPDASFDIVDVAGTGAAAGERVSVGAFLPGTTTSGPSAVDGAVLRGQVYGLVEVAATIDAGTLGGPVVDGSGRLVGIVVLRHQDDPGVIYALPASSIVEAMGRAEADGSLAAARARAESMGVAPYLPAAALDAQWISSAERDEAAAIADPAVICAPSTSADLSAVLAGPAPAADDPANGFAGLLYGALAWNLAMCDLRRIGVGADFLLRRETVGAWLTQENATLDRLTGAAAVVRRARQDAPDSFAGSPFAAVILRFDEELRQRVNELRAGPSAPPPSGPDVPPVPGPSPVPIEPIPATDGRAWSDPDPTRVIWAPTAFMSQEGLWNARSMNLGYWAVEYGVNPNVQLNLAASVPVMNFSLLPGAKFATQVGEMVHLSFGAHVGFWLHYPETEFVAMLYGGGPSLTVGTRDAFFNISLLVYGATIFQKDGGGDLDHLVSAFLLLPNVGGSVRVSEMVKLNAELYVPALVPDDGEQVWDYGEVWAFAYGLRIFGERMYGDVSFVIPLFSGVTSLLKYLPLGIPMLSFGFQL